MKTTIQTILIVTGAILFATGALAHGGGCKATVKAATGACCHKDSRTGRIHCHRNGKRWTVDQSWIDDIERKAKGAAAKQAVERSTCPTLSDGSLDSRYCSAI